MLMAFVGDVHGRVLHAIAALAGRQKATRRPFDLIVQVGDLGAYPEVTRMDAATLRYLEADPTQADFGRLLRSDGHRADNLRRVRREFAAPIHFIRGNHEDFAWLEALPIEVGAHTAPVDPFGLFRYVPDGTLISAGGWALGFLGGAEPGDPTDGAGAALDEATAARLLEQGRGAIDVLVTHDGPYGIGTSYYGKTQGAPAITRLVEHLRPRFHIAGHYHHLIGPRAHGETTYLGLAGLGAPPHPLLQGGWGAALDTESGQLTVFDEGPTDLTSSFDFDGWAEAFTRRMEQ